MSTISIATVKQAHKGHWFDRSSMRFFDSRVSNDAYLTQDKKHAFFVSSEQFHGSQKSEPRKYSVRVCTMATGDINTVAAFQGFSTRSIATRIAKRLADGSTKFYKTTWKDGKAIVYTSTNQDDKGYDVYSDTDVVFSADDNKQCEQWILDHI
jgi:hypothetical protein